MNPQINLLHLKFFCDAVIYKSISEAAKINFVTQSAVSQGINKLETCLGAQILIHTRKKFQLTDEGKVVFDQSRHVFKAIQNIYDGINQSKEPVTGTLRIGTTKSLGMSFIAPSYKKMKNNYPDVDLNVQLGGLNFIRNSIRQGDVELGVVVYDKNFSQFAKHPLKKGRFNLYQCADKRQKTIENGILVNYFAGTYVSELRDYLQKHTDLKIITELSGWEIIARFTELNLGIGFFPEYVLANKRYPKIKMYPLKLPPFEYEICVIYNKGEKLSKSAYAFIEQFSI